LKYPIFQLLSISLVFFLQGIVAAAQPGEKRIQYPAALKNSYFGINIGAINYRFTSAQLEPGFNTEKIQVPHTAVRLILYGHQFNKYLSAQITYMRPVDWVKYKNINGDNKSHSVWMNVAGLTLAGNVQLSKKISLFTEAGLGIITRKGFAIDNVPVVKNANYATLLAGGAVQYHLNRKWDLQVSTAWSPAHTKEKQPATIFFAAGFNYFMRSLSKERIERNIKSGHRFPKQLIQMGYTTNSFGYGVNNAVSKGPIPIFWGGEVHIKQGISINYQRNIFHARKVFAFDWGIGGGWWESRDNKDEVYTFSLYPVLKFMVARWKPADLFFEYSVAGPTFISKTVVDNKNTGKKFTFQDFMGMGITAGKKRNLNAGIRIAHFSNGNIYPYNDGLKIPLTFSAGYVFE
jgi:Lipid A 3-O-deacylase (PagL)/OmpA-like transmembrane domain